MELLTPNKLDDIAFETEQEILKIQTLKIKNIQNSLIEKEQLLYDLKERTEELIREVKLKNLLISKKNNDCEELCSKILRLKEILEEKNEEIKEKELTIKEDVNKINQKNNEMIEIKNLMTSYKKKIDNLNLQLEKTISNNNSQLKSLMKEKNNEINELMEKNKCLFENNDSLKILSENMLKENQQIKNHCEQIQNVLNSQQQEKIELEAIIKTLRIDLENKEKNKDSILVFQKEVEKIEFLNKNLEREKNELIEKRKIKKIKNKNKIELLENKLTAILTKIEDEKITFSNEKTRLLSEITHLSEKERKLLDQVNSLKNEVSNLKSENLFFQKNSEESQKKFDNDLKIKDLQFQQIINEKNILERNLILEQNEKEKLEKKCSEFERDNIDKKGQTECFNIDIVILQKENKILNEEVIKLKKGLDDGENEKKMLILNYEARIQIFEKELNLKTIMDTKIEDLQIALKDNDRMIFLKEKNINELNNKIVRLEKERDQIIEISTGLQAKLQKIEKHGKILYFLLLLTSSAKKKKKNEIINLIIEVYQN